MATSKPISLQVSDLVNWFRDGELLINDTFQRHSVWTSAAKTYLIDTILHELPIPKVYIRSRVDRATQKSVREVVDGQQRIRTLVEFADNHLRLTARSDDYAGLRYEDLDDEDQDRFLSYTITAEQLLNADDDDVIDIFARLNTYTVSLNAAEKRHAKYQTTFKFAVRHAAQDFRWFFEKYGVFSTQRRFRMADDVFVAELFGILLEGVKDGGASYLNGLYDRQDDDAFTEQTHKLIRKRAEQVVQFMADEIGNALYGPLSKTYHLTMIAAAYAHHRWGIPAGDLGRLPKRRSIASEVQILDRMARIENALTADQPPPRYREFVEASSGKTTRISTMRVRFKEMVAALAK